MYELGTLDIGRGLGDRGAFLLAARFQQESGCMNIYLILSQPVAEHGVHI